MDYDTVQGIALDAIVGVKKLFLDYRIGPAVIDVDNANEAEDIGLLVCYPRWKVVGLGLECTEDTTLAEDPIIQFGKPGDDDYFGIATFTNAVPEVAGNRYFHTVHPNIAEADLITATNAIAWTEGTGWNTELNGPLQIDAIEAASAGMTSGKFYVMAIIEVLGI